MSDQTQPAPPATLYDVHDRRGVLPVPGRALRGARLPAHRRGGAAGGRDGARLRRRPGAAPVRLRRTVRRGRLRRRRLRLPRFRRQRRRAPAGPRRGDAAAGLAGCAAVRPRTAGRRPAAGRRVGHVLRRRSRHHPRRAGRAARRDHRPGPARQRPRRRARHRTAVITAPRAVRAARPGSRAARPRPRLRRGRRAARQHRRHDQPGRRPRPRHADRAGGPRPRRLPAARRRPHRPQDRPVLPDQARRRRSPARRSSRSPRTTP